MTKERTREDWEHEGWIVGDGLLVGEDRAGFYDMAKLLHRNGDFDFRPQMAMLGGCIFVRGAFYKLVRPLPKLPEPGCAEKYQAKRQTTWEEYNAAHDAANAKLAAKVCQNDDDLQIEPEPGKWYVARYIGKSGILHYALCTEVGKRIALASADGMHPMSKMEILAEAPSPEELLK